MNKLQILALSFISILTFQIAAGAQATVEKPKMNVAILIFDGVQIIDYTGPYEVLGQWRRRNVYTVAEKADAVTTRMGMRVVPNYTFENQPKPDIIVIPGGTVQPHLDNKKILDWLMDGAKQSRYVLSVCNGAYFLGKAGLLDGLEATTTAQQIAGLQALAPKARIVSDKRYVDNGKIITSAGLTAGIDGALHLVEKLDGKGWAQLVAVSMEYNWEPETKYARASLADRKLPTGVYDPFYSAEAEPVKYDGDVNNWEEVWSVPSGLKPSEMLKRIDEKWAAEPKWARQNLKAADGTVQTSSWKFKGENGQVWNGSASVRPVEGKNRLLVSLKIDRGRDL